MSEVVKSCRSLSALFMKGVISMHHRVRLTNGLALFLVILMNGCSEPPRATISIHEAAKTGNVDQLKRHIYWGADVNSVISNDALPIVITFRDNTIQLTNGVAPLHHAVGFGRSEIVQLLLKNGADVNKLSTAGYAPIHIAAINGSTRIAQTLIENGADVNIAVHMSVSGDEEISDVEGYTPLIMAATTNNIEMLRLLDNSGADVNAVSSNGITPLISASISGNAELVKLLLSLGANPNFMNNDGLAAIHYACGAGKIEAVGALVNQGVDVNFPTKDGVRPIDIAIKSGNDQIVTYLKAKGAVYDIKSPSTLASFIQAAEGK